jgi:hypothetical protein
MKKLFYYLSSSKNFLKPVSLMILLILLNSTLTQAQSLDPFSRQHQFDYRILNQQAYVTTPPTSLNQEHNTLQWETIQTIVVPQRDPNSPLPPTKFNLDQVRNGRGSAPEDPAGWVNGNAGASNAHFVEGWSIPYRVNINDLALGAHSLDIEWDIKHSGANAIDFVTNYDLINYPAPSSHLFNFGHAQETINPLTEAGPWNDGTSSVIPPPTLPAGAVTNYYNTLMTYSNASGDANKFSIWNGQITSMVLITEGNLNANQSSTRMRIFFTNTEEDVVIAWGGHIAKGEGVWGNGNSASAVDGSPYHTRLIEWDPDGAGSGNPSSIGNQDRSLSAAAVQDPPICNLNGPSSLECTGTSSFTSGVAASDLSQGVTFDWDIEGATNCGTVTLSNETVGSATVTTSSTCGCSFSVVFIILKNGDEISRCVKVVTVTDAQAPAFTSTPTGSDLGCNPTGLPSPVNPSASDNCGTPTITSSNGSISSDGCSRSQTRTYKASDACGNTATIGQTFTWTADITGPGFTSCPAGSDLGCSPASIPEAGVATATDACSTPTITSSLGAEVGTGCSRSRTRTYTAIDACGNTSTCQQIFTYIVDATPPVFTVCQADVTVECGSPTSTAALGSATATDGCGSTTVTADDAAPVQVGCQSVIVRTWTARDACGNTATCVQRILVIDNTPPTITCNPDGSATASDACGSYYLYQNGTKWTAVDASGNIRTATCVPQAGSRIATTQITEEQKEQQPATEATEEKTKAAVPAKLIVQNVTVQTIPNPFNDRVRFVVTAPEAGYGTLDVMNMLGQKLKTVYQGRIAAGGQSFEMVLPKSRNTTLFYIFRMNGKQVTGKLVQMN